MSRTWNPEHLDGGIAVGESSYHTRRVVMINPMEKSWRKRAYVLWFGAVGTTYLHVYADSLEAALEECAEWLAEYAPGHIMEHGSEEHRDLLREACEERGILDGDLDFESEDVMAAVEAAEADLTYTESGFLTSYEWGICMEDVTAADLYAFIRGDTHGRVMCA